MDCEPVSSDVLDLALMGLDSSLGLYIILYMLVIAENFKMCSRTTLEQ